MPITIFSINCKKSNSNDSLLLLNIELLSAPWSTSICACTRRGVCNVTSGATVDGAQQMLRRHLTEKAAEPTVGACLVLRPVWKAEGPFCSCEPLPRELVTLASSSGWIFSAEGQSSSWSSWCSCGDGACQLLLRLRHWPQQDCAVKEWGTFVKKRIGQAFFGHFFKNSAGPKLDKF